MCDDEIYKKFLPITSKITSSLSFDEYQLIMAYPSQFVEMIELNIEVPIRVISGKENKWEKIRKYEFFPENSSYIFNILKKSINNDIKNIKCVCLSMFISGYPPHRAYVTYGEYDDTVNDVFPSIHGNCLIIPYIDAKSWPEWDKKYFHSFFP